MKFRKITLGMGLGSFWSDAEKLEPKLQSCYDAPAHADFGALIVRLVTEQQTIIDHQNSEIEKLKMAIQKIEMI